MEIYGATKTAPELLQGPNGRAIGPLVNRASMHVFDDLA